MPATSVDTMPVIYPGLHYRDAEAAMGWLTRAFGFVKRARPRRELLDVRHLSPRRRLEVVRRRDGGKV